VHNKLQKDRYTETDCIQEFSQVVVEKGNVYVLASESERNQNGSTVEPQVSQVEVSAGECSVEERSKVRTGFVAPTVAEVDTYCKEHNFDIDAQRFVDYYNANGWMSGKVPIRDWQKSVCFWASTERKSTGGGVFFNRLLEGQAV
jgi:hypothetical protein